MSRYDQNSNTWVEPKLRGWNATYLVVKPAQLQQSGFSWGTALCNWSVAVPTLTQNCSSRLEPLLTLLICRYRLPTPGLWMSAIKRHLDYPRCKTKNCWSCIETQFYDGAGSVSLPLLPIKAANTSSINVGNQSPLRLPKMHNQQWLTLWWCCLRWCGRQPVSPHFDYEGGQYTQKWQWRTKVNIVWLTGAYMNMTMNRTT